MALFPLCIGSVKDRWGFVPTYTCAWRESYSLITHTSMVTPMGAWDGLVLLGVKMGLSGSAGGEGCLSYNAFIRDGCS